MRRWREKRPQPGRNSDPAPVSVIIPCYNGAATIGRALASVTAQNRPPAEIIIVDDGSDRETRRVLEELAESHDSDHPGRLKIFYLPANRGPAAASTVLWPQKANSGLRSRKSA